jgi:NAD(P)-dependent dehydrogenase (short-subunit alcohol dehydrogenase family)
MAASGVSVVTGAATGIGEAIAKRLARRGPVIVVDRDEAGSDRVVAEIRAAGGTAAALIIDVSASGQVSAGVSQIEENHGPIETLVNNAAILGGQQGVEETSDALYEDIMGSTFKSAFLCTRAVLPGMLIRERGNIVNIGSIDSFIGVVGQAVYCAAKGALLQFTRALAVEYASRGIHANIVCPGAVSTPMLEQAIQGSPDPAAMKSYLVGKHPAERVGSAEEIAAAVEFLSSDEASFVHGAVLSVDGGWSAA